MPRNDPLLEPFALKRPRLRNRIGSTAHEPTYADDGLPGERDRLFRIGDAVASRNIDAAVYDALRLMKDV